MASTKIKTDGLIIKQQNIGEQDRLVTVLCRELGVVRAFVRNAKSIKSPNCASTGLLCYSDFSIYKSKDKYIIETARLKNLFTDLRTDITKTALAEYFCELAAAVCPIEQNAEEQLRLMLNGIHLVAKGSVPQLLIKAAVELRLAAISGYMPDLLMCRDCGVYEADAMYFLLNGGLKCAHCFQKNPENRAVLINVGVTHALRHIVFSEDKKLFSFSLSEESLQKLNSITESYIASKFEKHFQTLDFYKTISL